MARIMSRIIGTVGIGAIILLTSLAACQQLVSGQLTPTANPTSAPTGLPLLSGSPITTVPTVPTSPSTSISTNPGATPSLSTSIGTSIGTLASSGRVFKISMAFSPDWKTMAVGTLNEGAQVWNVGDGKMLYAVEVGRVNGVAFSPDGRLLALTWKSEDEKKHQIELRRASDGQLVRAFEEDEVWANSVAFSPDGKTLAVSADDGVQLWDVDTGTRKLSLSGQGGQIQGGQIAISPDGGIVASGVQPILVWQVTDGKLLYTLDGWYHVAFSPDGKTLATPASVNGTIVQLWDAQSGAPLHKLEPPAAQQGQLQRGQIHSLAFSRDGGMLAVGNNNFTAHVWQLSTGTLIHTLSLGSNNPAEEVAFSPDGKTLAILTDYEVQLWNVQNK
jgi:WD40 repeat protein